MSFKDLLVFGHILRQRFGVDGGCGFTKVASATTFGDLRHRKLSLDTSDFQPLGTASCHGICHVRTGFHSVPKELLKDVLTNMKIEQGRFVEQISFHPYSSNGRICNAQCQARFFKLPGPTAASITPVKFKVAEGGAWLHPAQVSKMSLIIQVTDL